MLGKSVKLLEVSQSNFAGENYCAQIFSRIAISLSINSPEIKLQCLNWN